MERPELSFSSVIYLPTSWTSIRPYKVASVCRIESKSLTNNLGGELGFLFEVAPQNPVAITAQPKES